MKTACIAKGFFPTRRISFATDDTSLYYICHTSHITTLRGMCAVFVSLLRAPHRANTKATFTRYAAIRAPEARSKGHCPGSYAAVRVKRAGPVVTLRIRLV